MISKNEMIYHCGCRVEIIYLDDGPSVSIVKCDKHKFVAPKKEPIALEIKR